MENEQQLEATKKRRFELLFRIRRSARYHNSRLRFFDGTEKTLRLVIVLSGFTAVATALADAGGEWVKLAAIIVAACSAIDLVLEPGKMARLHADLARKFKALDRDMAVAGERMSEEQVNMFQGRFINDQAEEPPTLKVLDAMCHNDLIRALDLPDDEKGDIDCLQRTFAQYVDLWPHTIEKRRHKKQDPKPPTTATA